MAKTKAKKLRPTSGELAEVLRSLSKDSGVTQKEIAEHMGINAGQVSRMFNPEIASGLRGWDILMSSLEAMGIDLRDLTAALAHKAGLISLDRTQELQEENARLRKDSIAAVKAVATLIEQSSGDDQEEAGLARVISIMQNRGKS